LENFERGEIVSPRGSIASKVSGLNLATPDARHRRPLKFFSENRGAKFPENNFGEIRKDSAAFVGEQSAQRTARGGAKN
jgi:hypothetical protein